MGGTIIPSMKMWEASPERLPATEPPTSPQCARSAGKASARPSENRGQNIAMSFMWVPQI